MSNRTLSLLVTFLFVSVVLLGMDARSSRNARLATITEMSRLAVSVKDLHLPAFDLDGDGTENAWHPHTDGDLDGDGSGQWDDTITLICPPDRTYRWSVHESDEVMLWQEVLDADGTTTVTCHGLAYDRPCEPEP